MNVYVLSRHLTNTRHLQSLLAPAMEAERKNAYAVRLQCWWRGILAVRAKSRRRLDLTEMPLGDLREGEEKAALAIQVLRRVKGGVLLLNFGRVGTLINRSQSKPRVGCS